VAAQTKDDGTFVLINVPPDSYRVGVTGLPDGSYVKAIHYGGQDITNTGLDASSGGGQLEILVSPDAADLSGMVRNEKGEAMIGVTVSAWDPSTTVRTVVTGINGSFFMRSLPPGDYLVIAAEQLDQGAMQDPGLRTTLEGKAVPVKLGPGSHGTTDLTPLAQDLVDAAIANLP
jgi:hypothetical protein